MVQRLDGPGRSEDALPDELTGVEADPIVPTQAPDTFFAKVRRSVGVRIFMAGTGLFAFGQSGVSNTAGHGCGGGCPACLPPPPAKTAKKREEDYHGSTK